MSKREAPTVIVSAAAIPMPTAAERAAMKPKRGGNQGYYDLSVLTPGKSLAIIGRTTKNLSTTVSQANSKEWPVTDNNGKPVMIKSADGASKPKTEKRVFFAVDCDPAKDPEKANARIWREK
jgi:hypothetical protein